jgi:hypothetical protein
VKDTLSVRVLSPHTFLRFHRTIPPASDRHIK